MPNVDLNEAVLELEWRKCAPDWDSSTPEELLEAFCYWAKKYWYIKTPGRRQLFKIREAQRHTANLWINERYSISLKARQVGFSTLAGAVSFWATFFYGDRDILMISKGEREAVGLLAKARYGYRFLPDWMKLRGPVVEMNQTEMRMTNGSCIKSLPSAMDPARGETAWKIFVDEMGQLPNSEEAYASIEPVADIGGSIHMLGTANGEGNLFHKLWVGCKVWGNGTNRYVGNFFSWRAVDERDDAWYARQLAELPDWQVAQEYPDNPDEAFLRSGRPVFNLQKLRELELLPPTDRGYLRRLPNQPLEFVADGGLLRIWKPPVGGKHPHRYSMGVDVAEGLEHGDYSSIHVVDANTHEVVAHWHGHIDPDLLGSDIVPLIGEWYNYALAVVESNNHGLTTLTALQRVKYAPIFRRRRLGNRQKTVTEAMGWATTAVSKPLAIDELAKALRDGQMKLWDAETVAELRTYVREGDGKMHGSPHDDRVMSLAIANQGLKYVHMPEYRRKAEPPVGSFGWWMKQEIWGEKGDEREYIGARTHRVA